MIVDAGNNDEDGHNDEDNEGEEEEECDDTHVDDDANIIDDAPSTSSTTTTATTTTTLNTAIYPLLMIVLIRRHLRFRSRMMKCLTVALSETKSRSITFWTTINGGGLIPLQLPPGTTTQQQQQQQQHKRMRDSEGRQTDGDDDDDMGLKTSSPPPPPKHNKLEPADFDNSIGFTATTDIYDLNQSPPPPPSSQQHAFRPESFISLMVCDLDDAINTTTPPEQQQQQQQQQQQKQKQLQHLDVPSEEILQDWETQLLYEQMLRRSRLLRLVPSHRRERR